MSIFQICLPIPKPLTPHSLSFLSTNSHSPFPLLLPPSSTPLLRRLVIRNGGGPRTFPGGVSKWQWKRMQAKKAKQLLRARLAREREVYEMRKRAELKAAVAELERPWEAVKDRAPRLFSVSADEQVKVLADRFQKPGGFDMWSERDGPQLFSTVDGLPSARFFPKGVVYSTKPYGKICENTNSDESFSLLGSFSEVDDYGETNEYTNSGSFGDSSSSEGQIMAKKSIENTVNRNGKGSDGKFRNKPYNKIGRNSNAVANDAERNGYKNADRVGNSLSSERQIKANKWIKNPKDRKEMISSNGKLRKQPYQKTGKIANVEERLSLPSSVTGVGDNIAGNGFKNFDRFRDNLSIKGQGKADKWLKNSTDRNEKIGRNGKFGNKPFGKFGVNTNGAENLSVPRSFSEFEDCIEKNGFQNANSFRNSFSRDSQTKKDRSTRIFTERKGKIYNNGELRNKGNTRRFQVEKSNTLNESKGLSSEVYDMNMCDDGSYEFEL